MDSRYIYMYASEPAGYHKHPLGEPKQVFAVDCKFESLLSSLNHGSISWSMAGDMVGISDEFIKLRTS